MPGTTLKASPARRTVGTAVRRCGALRVLAGRDRLGRGGEGQQRVDALVGRRARVRAAPVRGHAQRAGRLAARRPRPRRPRPAGRPRSTGRRRSPRSAGRGRRARCATPRRTRAAARPRRSRSCASASARRTPRASTSPPFMSIVPEPRSCSPSRVSGRCSSWATTVSRWPSSSSRREPEPVRRMSRSGAWSGEEHSHALDRRLVGRQRRDERGGLVGAVDVAAGRRDRHERLELALGAGRDGGGVLSDPRIHGSRTLSRHGLWTPRRRSRPGLRPGGHGRELPALRAPRAAGRAALLSRRRDHGLHQAVLLLPRPRRRHERAGRGGRRHLRPGRRHPTRRSPPTTG